MFRPGPVANVKLGNCLLLLLNAYKSLPCGLNFIHILLLWCVHTCSVHVDVCECAHAGVHVSVCAQAGVHADVCVCAHAGVHVDVCVCAHAGMHVSVCVHAGMHVSVHVHMHVACFSLCVHTQTCMCTCKCARFCVCAHMQVCMWMPVCIWRSRGWCLVSSSITLHFVYWVW